MYHPNPIVSAPVFDSTKPRSWEDLDLSAVVGSNYCLVKISVLSSTVGTNISFRTDGNTSDYDNTTAAPRGCQYGYCGIGLACSFDVVTSAAGVVEWYSSYNNAPVKVYVHGWSDIQEVDPTESGAATVAAHSYPNGGWAGSTTLDLSAVSDDDTLFHLAHKFVGGVSTHYNCIRAGDDTSDLQAAGTSVSTQGGVGYWALGGATKRAGILVPSSDHGKYETMRDPGLVSSTFDVFVDGYINTSNGWARSRTKTHSDVTPPVAWTDLDLSAVVLCRALVILKVERVSGGGAGTLQIIAFRENGDSLDYRVTGTGSGASQCIGIDSGKAAYVCVTTDSSGIVEWVADSAAYGLDVTVMGWITSNTDPVLTGTAPAASPAAPNAAITFTTSDDFQVDQATINLTLTDPDAVPHAAITNGVFQAGYSGTITANGSNGYDVSCTVDAYMMIGAWTADADCDDEMGGSASDSWGWTVGADAPTVQYVYPEAGFTTEPDQIRFSIVDDWGIDPATVDLSVVVSGDGQKRVIAAIIAGVVQDWWQIDQVYTGVSPERIDVIIRSWPMDLSASYRRIQMVISADSIVGTSL